jgi:hypothetical protein
VTDGIVHPPAVNFVFKKNSRGRLKCGNARNGTYTFETHGLCLQISPSDRGYMYRNKLHASEITISLFYFGIESEHGFSSAT